MGVKKVYLINQDYSFGQSVHAQARAMLQRESAPISKLLATSCIRCRRSPTFLLISRRSKPLVADSDITGNWGRDFALLPKAGRRRRSANRLVRVLWLLARREYSDQADRFNAPRFCDRGRRPKFGSQMPPRNGRLTLPGETRRRPYLVRFPTKCGCWRRRLLNQIQMIQRPLPPVKLEGMTVEQLHDGGDTAMRKNDLSDLRRTCISPASALWIPARNSTKKHWLGLEDHRHHQGERQ